MDSEDDGDTSSSTYWPSRDLPHAALFILRVFLGVAVFVIVAVFVRRLAVCESGGARRGNKDKGSSGALNSELNALDGDLINNFSIK